MATKAPLIIGYGGSLAYHDPDHPPYHNSFIRDHFWTYTHLSTDPSTRSPYFLFRAFQLLRERYAIDGDLLQLHLWGNIDERNRLQAETMGVSQMVKFEGYLTKSESLRKSNSCDLLFLPLESGTANGKPLFIPGKLFEYLKAGKPVLALGGDCTATAILRRSGLGVILDPLQTPQLAECLAGFVRNPGTLASYVPDNEYISQYSFEQVTSRVAAVFDEVLKMK